MPGTVKPKSGFSFESSTTSNKFYSFLCVLSNFRPTLTKYDYNYMLVVVCFSHHGLLLERVMALALLLIVDPFPHANAKPNCYNKKSMHQLHCTTYGQYRLKPLVLLTNRIAALLLCLYLTTLHFCFRKIEGFWNTSCQPKTQKYHAIVKKI